jgi:hypothetical protein
VDGEMTVTAQFHGEGITNIDRANHGTVLHAADVSTSIWVWSRDAVQPASRAVVHAGLASSLLQLGQPENAMAQWREALRLFPEFVTARYNLACALLDAHRKRQREEQRLQKQQEQEEQQEKEQQEAAAGSSAAESEGEQEGGKKTDEMHGMGLDMELEAVHHLGVVLSLAPDHPKANNTVANWLALRGDRAGAAEHYARAGEHSDMGLSSLPAIGPVAHGYPHSNEKRTSSALTARYSEHTLGHWNNPTDAASASTKNRFLLSNDRISEKYGSNHGSPKQLMNAPSSPGALAMVAVGTPDHTPSLEMGALPLMPGNGMIEPHSNALIVANPVPALVEARQPFGIGRAMTATPSSASWAERSTAMTTSTSSPLKKPLAERPLMTLTGHMDTARREEPPPTTATYQGTENWRAQRMRDSRGTVDAQEEEDRGERQSMLSTSGARGSAEPSPAVLPPLPGAISPTAAAAAAAQDAVPKAPKHLPGSEPDAIAAELSERLNRRSAPARGGDGIEDVWRGWMPVPSLPQPTAATLPKVPTPGG